MYSPNEMSSLSFIYDNENIPRRPINTRTSGQMNFEAHLMPPPTRFPWNSNEMTWTNNSTNVIINGVMEFKGGDSNLFDTKPKCITKRKATTDDDQLNISLEPLTKQQITDEKMAIHLNSLHISSSFTSHESKPPSWDDASSSSSSSSSSMEPEPSTSNSFCSKNSSNCDSPTGFQSQNIHFNNNNNNKDKNTNNFSVTMSSKDLEQKLRNAQRITICEEVRRIQSDSILPESIIERIERPCTALVLWQPPPSSLQMFSSYTNKYLTPKHSKYSTNSSNNITENIEITSENNKNNNSTNNNTNNNNNMNIRVDDEDIDSNNLMDFDMDL